MTKQHFIALADMIMAANKFGDAAERFSPEQLRLLADFCKRQNANFDRDRWMDYVNGIAGPNGGKRHAL